MFRYRFMLYSIVRPIAKLGIRVFYRKIYLSNTARIPRNKPVILAANHPTGFMEPCILACYLDRPLSFLVRGDFFKKPLYRRLLNSLHMLPVYRVKDGGLSVVKNNFETFDYCFRALRENKTLMILAEGSAEHEKRLRPLKKGTARIAMGTLEAYPDLENVYIVPVGVNYTYAELPRTEVMIDFGEPMLASDYLAFYKENPNQTINDFTGNLYEHMAERIVIIHKKADEELTEYLLQIDRSQRTKISEKSSPQFLEAEKRIADGVNSLNENAKNTLLTQARDYFGELQKLGISDVILSRRIPSFLLSGLLLILGFPLFLLGFVCNALPIWLAKSIADKRVRRPEFYAPVYWAISLGTYLIWWILWLVGLLFFAAPIALLWLLLMPLLGYFSILFFEYFQQQKKYFRASRLSPTERENLMKQRTVIWEAFQNAQQNEQPA